MFLGTSSKFSDLAHSARQSTVKDPDPDGQTTRLQPTCVLSHTCGPVQVLESVPSASPHSTPLSRLARGPLWPLIHPSLPQSLGLVRGKKSTMGLGRWSGPCREWSGPRVQGREMWGATNSCWQKWLFFSVQSSHTTQKPRGPLPRHPVVPAWGMGSHFVSAMSYCVERNKDNQGAEMTMSIKHSHIGEMVWHQQILAGK